MTNSGRVVVAGAGLAGLRTAEELRERGFAGPITLIGAEARPPYDRPPLGADQRDRAGEAALPQFLHGPEPGQARAGHHYPSALGHDEEITAWAERA